VVNRNTIKGNQCRFVEVVQPTDQSNVVGVTIVLLAVIVLVFAQLVRLAIE
jgi:hypothetical protein